MTRGADHEQRYGPEHRRRRLLALAQLQDGDPCTRCGQPMYRGEALHLDHDDHDPTRYRGLSHKTCNLAAGARKTNRARRYAQPPTPNPSRQW